MPKRQKMKTKAIIFGNGFVGKATANSLNLEVQWHDPVKGLGVEKWQADYAFICVPTPADGHGLDTTAVNECLRHLRVNQFAGQIVIRSTCTPASLLAMEHLYGDVIYFPEFLRESLAFYDCHHPHLVVLGGKNTKKFEHWLHDQNYGGTAKWTTTNIQTAAVIKLGLNTALAAKVAVFNCLNDFSSRVDADWDAVCDTIGSDWRIGQGQTQVPGPDGKFGFGGKCLPKDLGAVASITQNPMLNAVLHYNNTIRSKT